MILQRPCILLGDAGFEPGASASEVWCATNEPPHSIEVFVRQQNYMKYEMFEKLEYF